MTWRSRYSRAHTLSTSLSTSSSKSGPTCTVSFWRFLCDQVIILDDDVVDRWHEAFCSRQMTWSFRYSRAHAFSTSLSTSSSKSGPTPSIFLINYLMTMWSTDDMKLSLKFRAHFVDHFPDRGAQPRKQRPSSGDRGRPLYPKKTQGFAPKRVFSREFTRSRSLTLPNYLMMMWIDMMMWLPWWWES